MRVWVEGVPRGHFLSRSHAAPGRHSAATVMEQVACAGVRGGLRVPLHLQVLPADELANAWGELARATLQAGGSLRECAHSETDVRRELTW